VTTHAPIQALACPQKNAFGTPDLGVLPALSFDQNASFGLDSGSKLANYFLVFISPLNALLTRTVLRLSIAVDKE